MNRDDLLAGLTGDILAYVMHGRVSEGILASGLKPEGLDDRYADYRLLVDLHFVLREDVVEFVRRLPDHLRRLETSTRNHTRTSRGSVQGRVNWTETARRRVAESPGDRSLFVCDTRTENYDTDENLVLKRLLAVVYDTVRRVEEYLTRDYEWVHDSWHGEDDLVDELRRVVERNVHVKRIREPAQYEPTDRMLAAAARSRQDVYRAAAQLLDHHRAVHRGDEDAVRDLLERTAITPDDDETLLELFVLFKLIATLDGMREGSFELQTIDSGRQEVARFSGEKEVVVYHDNSGPDEFSFRSFPEGKADSELSRTEMVQQKAHEVAEEYFQREFRNQTGRPDVIVLEVIDHDAGSFEYLVTEVKNSTNTQTIRTGIKETLEYLAFFRQDGAFVNGDGEGGFFGDGSNGLLVVQDLERETQPIDDQQGIRILQASELDDHLQRVLDDLV